MVLPDVFIDHDKPEKMYELAGLDAPGIVATVLSTLGREAGELGAGGARLSRVAVYPQPRPQKSGCYPLPAEPRRLPWTARRRA